MEKDNLHRAFDGSIINLNYVAMFFISNDFKYIPKTNGWDGEVIPNDDLTKPEYTPVAKMNTGELIILGRSWDKKQRAQRELEDIAFKKVHNTGDGIGITPDGRLVNGK